MMEATILIPDGCPTLVVAAVATPGRLRVLSCQILLMALKGIIIYIKNTPIG